MIIEHAAIEELLEVRWCIAGRVFLRVERFSVSVGCESRADERRFDVILRRSLAEV